MANQERHTSKSADLDPVTLHLVVPIGAGGAPGVATRSRGFVTKAPITHGSTGQYTLNLLETWVAILGYKLNCKQATYSATGADHVNLVTDSVKSAGTVLIECLTAAGAPVDPASGDILFLTLELQMTAP